MTQYPVRRKIAKTLVISNQAIFTLSEQDYKRTFKEKRWTSPGIPKEVSA